MIYKTLHRKLKIEQHNPHQKPDLNARVQEGQAVPAPQVAPVLLIHVTLSTNPVISHD